MDNISSLLKKQTKSQTATKNSALSSEDDNQIAFEGKIQQMDLEQKEKMAQVQANMLGLPYINLEKLPIGPETLKVLPEKEAARLKIIPFYRTAEEIRIGGVRPGTPEILNLVNKLKDEYHVPVKLYLLSDNSFELAFKQYANLPKFRKTVKGVEITEDDLAKFDQEIKSIADLQKLISNVNASELITAVVAIGLRMRASDIHFESEENDFKIRYRIDGVLQEAAALPLESFYKISNRIKLLSRLKLNVTGEPQDGRFTIFLSNDKIDVRVSILPTTYGESTVMRLLKASSAGLKFDDLGLRGSANKRLEKEITKPNGMIITTGPTGSGKTTTLYSILLKLNTVGTKIITLEDPVEYKLEGINQSQLDKKRGYDFATGLRSILRQDPDIIMVGEIRDFETADTAINAALTGHLVISTLHTNSAAGALPRLLSMGVKPFLLSPALNAIIGQRLVRRICKECSEADQLDEKTLKQLDEIIISIPENELGDFKGKTAQQIQWKKGVGCDACHGIGFKGRIGIYEIMVMSKEIEQLISSEKISEYSILEIATKQGMITMTQDGILRAMEEMTTVDEVFRVAKSF